jgi:hypothetical protein
MRASKDDEAYLATTSVVTQALKVRSTAAERAAKNNLCFMGQPPLGHDESITLMMGFKALKP